MAVAFLERRAGKAARSPSPEQSMKMRPRMAPAAGLGLDQQRIDAASSSITTPAASA